MHTELWPQMSGRWHSLMSERKKNVLASIFQKKSSTRISSPTGSHTNQLSGTCSDSLQIFGDQTRIRRPGDIYQPFVMTYFSVVRRSTNFLLFTHQQTRTIYCNFIAITATTIHTNDKKPIQHRIQYEKPMKLIATNVGNIYRWMYL